MIALKNNRVDKWNSKWNKIYLWLVFRRIQIWSLWWFSFYSIWHYTNDGLLHCFHYNVHVLYHYFLCICERHDFIINDRACVWFQALWKRKKKVLHNGAKYGFNSIILHPMTISTIMREPWPPNYSIIKKTKIKGSNLDVRVHYSSQNLLKAHEDCNSYG